MKHIHVVAQSRLTLCDPIDYTVHGILQARILEWVKSSMQKNTETKIITINSICVIITNESESILFKIKTLLYWAENKFKM